jgi:hypothetical protein
MVRRLARLSNITWGNRVRPITLSAVLGLLAALLPSIAWSTPVTLPLNFDYLVLNEAFKETVFKAQSGPARLWQGSNPCEYLEGAKPRLSDSNGLLKLDADAHLSLGVSVGSKCLSPVTWSGIIDAKMRPYATGFALRFEVTDVNLLNEKFEKTLIAGKGFDLIKQNYIPLLQNFSYDLNPALRQFEHLAALGVTSPDDAIKLHAALATIKLLPDVTVEPAGLHAALTIDVPQVAMVTTPPTATPPPLTPAEIDNWRTAVDQWDSFLVFAIKQVGVTVPDPAVRSQLFDVLMDSRERLVDALQNPQRGPDPVRMLFLDEWSRLHSIIEAAAVRGVLGNRALEFLSFISAGDALFAFDQAAPALGMRISADDLRQLARVMAPRVETDPLTFTFDEDPELQRLFGIQPPLESAGPFEAAPEPIESPIPTPSPTASAPLETPTTPATPLRSAVDDPFRVVILVSGFAASEAQAAENPADVLRELGVKLHDIVVTAANADGYRSDLAQLLDLTADYTMVKQENDAISKIYPVLVRTAAWQESCWRQFVVRHDRVRYLESRSGDIGLMQVNKYVWRGMYRLPRLKWDIVYNSTAGADILKKLLLNAPDHLKPPWSTDPVGLARATYAAYNGGPAEYDRWLLRKYDSRTARAADAGFALKLTAMRDGRSFDILSCAAEWDRSNVQ